MAFSVKTRKIVWKISRVKIALQEKVWPMILKKKQGTFLVLDVLFKANNALQLSIEVAITGILRLSLNSYNPL